VCSLQITAWLEDWKRLSSRGLYNSKIFIFYPSTRIQISIASARVHRDRTSKACLWRVPYIKGPISLPLVNLHFLWHALFHKPSLKQWLEIMLSVSQLSWTTKIYELVSYDILYFRPYIPLFQTNIFVRYNLRNKYIVSRVILLCLGCKETLWRLTTYIGVVTHS